MCKYSLRLHKICKEYDGIQALRSVSLHIEQGSIVGLNGPNGAGKTTLFDIISGVTKASSGELRILDRVIRNPSIVEIANLGVRRTFQNIRLFEDMTAEDNVLVACDSKYSTSLLSLFFLRKQVRTEWTRNKDTVRHSLDSFGLWQKQYTLASNLSHGQRRLLELSRAMVGDARILLLDEPTAGVFPETREVLIKRIRDYRDSTKATIIVVEHDMGLLNRLCDHVLRLVDGKIIT